MGGRWAIRRAHVDDLPELVRAERACFSDPWSESSLAEVLQSDTGVSLVAEAGDRLAGYLLARTIAGEAEILNLAVVPGSRRKGIGRSLLESALDELTRAGAQSVFLEVRESNDLAQRLYGQLGFRTIGLRPGYYTRPRENAFVLKRELTTVA